MRELVFIAKLAQIPHRTNVCLPSSDLLRHSPPWSEPTVLDEPPPGGSGKTTDKVIHQLLYFCPCPLIDDISGTIDLGSDE